MEHNGEHYRYSEEKLQWQHVCKFIHVDEEYSTSDQCVNFSIRGGFCDRHEDGIDRERKQSTASGDDIEQYIYNLLCSHQNFRDVTIIGRENSELDIIYKVKDELDLGIDQFRGIQIKTLSINNPGYNLMDINNYRNTTVIVGVSIDKTKLCIFFKWELFGLDFLYINFNNPKPEFRKNIFYGMDDNSLGYTFLDRLVVDCKISTIYSEANIYKTVLVEKESLDRLKNICVVNNFIFEYKTTSDSSVDCIINSKRIQCKYSDFKDYTYYQFKIDKIFNNSPSPYTDRDGIDIFIFETSLHEFYVIPINVLIYFGFIRTQNYKGKNVIQIHPSSSPDYHWTKSFINRFDLLNTNEIFDVRSILDMNHVVNIFNYQCFLRNIDSNRDMNNLSTNLCTIGTKTV
jgi:hypothetical protein